MAAVTARPAASDADSGLDCGMVNSGTPRPTTTTNRVPRASADSRASRPGCRSSAERSGWAAVRLGGCAWHGHVSRGSFAWGRGPRAVCQRSLGVGWSPRLAAQRPGRSRHALAASADHRRRGAAQQQPPAARRWTPPQLPGAHASTQSQHAAVAAIAARRTGPEVVEPAAAGVPVRGVPERRPAAPDQQVRHDEGQQRPAARTAWCAPAAARGPARLGALTARPGSARPGVNAATATPTVMTSITPENGSSRLLRMAASICPQRRYASDGQPGADERQHDADGRRARARGDVRGQLVDGERARDQGQRRPDPGQEGPFVGQRKPVVGGGAGLPPRWFAHCSPLRRLSAVAADQDGANSTLPGSGTRSGRAGPG